MEKRKKVKVVILVFIIISIIIATILIILNNRNKFELNTKYKYRIKKVIVSEPDISTEVRPITTHYYEINLKNNKVDLREDYYYGGNQEYSRKLINSKKLTKEEKTELEELLNKIIKENKTEQITTYLECKIGECYYIVSTEGIDSVLLDNKEDIEIFERIVN